MVKIKDMDREYLEIELQNSKCNVYKLLIILAIISFFLFGIIIIGNDNIDVDDIGKVFCEEEGLSFKDATLTFGGLNDKTVEIICQEKIEENTFIFEFKG